jgi:DNA-binding CsgD family transcriptional regulator
LQVFGRDRELARVEAVLGAVQDGSARLVVEGEPGIGKTTVWRSGVLTAERRGYDVLSSRPAEADASLSYAGLADLVDGIDDEAFDTLPAPQRQAIDVALLRAASEGRPPEPRAVFAAFVSLLRALAGERPTVVAVDDVQWLDRPSAGALAFAARRVDALPIAFLFSQRTNGNGADNDSSWFEPDERIRLTALTAGALHGLIKARLDWSPSRPTLMRIHGLCAGNAFFALEIARVLVESGATEARDAWPTPDDVRRLVADRVATLPVAAQQALRTAAAASHPTADLLDGDALRAARDAGLISVGRGGRVFFAHPLYASAVYAGMSATERRRVHAELAARDLDPEERARHLALATVEPDEDVSSELDRAAARARGRGAPATAAELQERALVLTPPADRPSIERRALAAALDSFLSGSLEHGADLLTGVAERASEPTLRAEALRLLAQARVKQERYGEAWGLLHAAATEAGEGAPTRARVELDLALANISVSLDHSDAGPHADAALGFATQSSDSTLLAQALATKGLIDVLLSRGVDEEQMARALELENRDSAAPLETRPTALASCVAFYTGRFDEARALAYPLRERLLERGEDTELPLLAMNMGWLECRLGNFAAARKLADEALETAALGGTMTAHALAFSAYLDAHTGDVDSCRHRAADAVGEAGANQHCLVLIWACGGLGHTALALGDDAAACEALELLTSFYENETAIEPVMICFLPDSIEAHIAVGDVERATALTDLMTRSAERFDRPGARPAALRGRALLRAAAGELEAARAVADEAVAGCRLVPLPLELARALIVLGQIERRARRKAPARAALEEALAICERIGASLWASRARAELSRLGVRSDDPDDLSPTERRVAALAASGLTNREIATAAFMSQKTVEANLSRVYRKLGIRSRAELGLRLADRVSAA